jgi:hypothetical protein
MAKARPGVVGPCRRRISSRPWPRGEGHRLASLLSVAVCAKSLTAIGQWAAGEVLVRLEVRTDPLTAAVSTG